MGYLFQLSSPSPNCQSISASVWFQISGAGNECGFITCGSSVTDPQSYAGFGIGATTDPGNFLYTFTTGSGDTYTTVSNPNDTYHATSVQWQQTVPISPDAWHHLAGSFDASSLASSIRLDSIDRSMTGTRSVLHSGSNHDFAISNLGIGIPDLPESSYPNGTLVSNGSVIRFGDYQFWANKYIDWNNDSNYSKVVNLVAGHGTPVDPATAAASFGQQSLLFKGNHTQFNSNLGTAGSFSLVGTEVDFTPAPSYG